MSFSNVSQRSSDNSEHLECYCGSGVELSGANNLGAISRSIFWSRYLILQIHNSLKSFKCSLFVLLYHCFLTSQQRPISYIRHNRSKLRTQWAKASAAHNPLISYLVMWRHNVATSCCSHHHHIVLMKLDSAPTSNIQIKKLPIKPGFKPEKPCMLYASWAPEQATSRHRGLYL